jgi:glucose-6-phosphate 1-dehydrogenase
VAQNHLCQILSLIAMEPATSGGADGLRDAKVRVLNQTRPLELSSTVIGQYVGYKDDKGVPKDSISPTFAAMRVAVDSPRWRGVPFFLRCGKALKSRKCEVILSLIQGGEIRIQVQPKPSVSVKLRVESPGLEFGSREAEATVDYWAVFPSARVPSAYARLLLDVFEGRQESFVREDELTRAWAIFTPLLQALESQHVSPRPYAFGSSGPKEAIALLDTKNAARSKL